MDGLKQLVDALAGLGANEDDGGIGHEAEVLLQLFAHGVHRVAVLLDSVPLVDGDDACLALLMRVARDLGVLLGKADRGIDHDNADTAALDRGQTAQNAVALHAALHLAALAQTGGIGKDELAVLVLDHCVDGIAGGACLVGNDEAVFAQNMVDQAGLADIGAADDSNGDAVIGVLFLLLKIEVSADGVQQVTGAVAVYAGDRDQLAEAEAVKIIQLHRGLADLVALVDGQHHGLAAAHQHTGNILILRRHTGGQLSHHDDAVGGVDGQLGLLTHVGQQAVINAGLDAAGVHQQELVAGPFAIAEDTVAGNARRVLDNGEALAGQLIENSGLAHIGAAHNGYDRFCHVCLPPSYRLSLILRL